MGTEMVEELLFISSSIWKKKKGAGLDIHLFILLLSTYSGRIVLGLQAWWARKSTWWWFLLFLPRHWSFSQWFNHFPVSTCFDIRISLLQLLSSFTKQLITHRLVKSYSLLVILGMGWGEAGISEMTQQNVKPWNKTGWLRWNYNIHLRTGLKITKRHTHRCFYCSVFLCWFSCFQFSQLSHGK